MTTDARRAEIRTAADRVATVLDDAFAWLARLADRLRALHEHALSEQRALRSGELTALREPIFARLREQPALIAGTGVILAEDVLADRAHWLEWWQNEPDGRLTFLEVDHNPASVAYYDYASAAWFALPRRTGSRVVVGPYVDYSGTDEYMLTLAHPAHSGQRFLGVAATDIRADVFESLLLRALAGTGPPAALVNAKGRVVASNTPHKITGSLVTDAELDRDWPGVTVAAPGAGECAGLPWRLSVLRG
ncbi:cache domain-containing protein [Prauserella muralis]|uniref:Uncharacterized protein n=1 Tax=Prauserella muralis TaxID=588067 RepID=A0A2V4AQW8_9PSEU|nr:cache domain-containing protein [Prauserella muralis]PXY22779.1 hypothetical protein BAY60_23590 [Prauserella muralis]TWE28517.1 hypothetical protein FHX69_1174 [Prauserella muralis]